MAQLKIDELTKDLDELNSISDQLKRPKNIDVISLQKKRIETELTNLREQLRSEEKKQPTPKPSADSATKRYECEITNYAWDQSDKFVKLFVVLNGVQNAGEDNVVVTFTENSIQLKVTGLDNRDHVFGMNNLLSAIDVAKSYRKVKTDTIAIYAKKSQEGKSWSHLTAREKQLASLKTSSANLDDMDADKDDPSSGLMKVMQKLYESGDSDMKRMIAKTWTEGQEKKLNNLPTNFDL